MRTVTTTTILAVFGLLLACKSAPPEPAEYPYAIKLADPAGSPVYVRAPLLLDGQPLVLDDQRRALVPSGTKMAGRTVTTDVATSCGPQSVEFAPATGMDERHEQTQREGTVKYGPQQPVLWDMVAKGPVPDAFAHLYIDNQDGAQPAVVRLGKAEFTIDARASKAVGTVVGDCPEALDITLNGAPIGRAVTAEKNQATVVSVAGGGCYVQSATRYATKDVHGIAGTAGPRRFELKPGEHTMQVPAVDQPFGVAPESLTVRTGGRTEKVTATQTTFGRCLPE